MRYPRLISFGLLCSPIAISALENSSNKEIGLDSNKSGIFIDGDLRDLTKIKINKKDSYIFALNNSEIKILERE